MSARRVRSRRGFTLWEMTMVFAVLAVTALFVVPQWLRLGDDAPRDRTGELLALLREARTLAIADRHIVTVHMDPVSGAWRVDTSGGSGRGPFRAGVLALGAAETLETDRARLRFVFQPSGAAVGDTVLVRGRSGAALIALDPWSGTAVAHAR